MLISQLAKILDAEVVVPENMAAGDITLLGIAPIDSAAAGQLTFLTSPEYEKYLHETAASAVIIKTAQKGLKIHQIIHKNPYFAMAKAAQLFYRPSYSQSGVSPKAVVHPESILGLDVIVYPFVFIGKGAVIGDRSVIYPGTYIGDFAQIGADTVIHANVSIGDKCRVGSRVIIHAGSALGPDGFGFAPGNGELAKIPQVGIVVIEDDVEIGGVCSIDRATMGETRIGRGTKLDSHVHVAHNVKIGQNCMLCGGAKIAGSTVIGDWCVFGGESSVTSNIRLGNGIRIGAKAGVTKSLDEPGDYMGFPAIPAGQWRRQIVVARRAEGLEKRVLELESAFKEFSK